jgi:hypothetical protein
MIPPSAWLREVWGPKGPPAFGSIEEMQATLDLVMGHYNRVAEMLVPPVQCMRRLCPIDFVHFCLVTGLPEGLGQQTEIWHGGWWGWFCGSVRGGGASAGEPALA